VFPAPDAIDGDPALTHVFPAPDAIDGDPALTHVFPTPDAIAAADLSGFGLTRARAGALRTFAAAVADGSLALESSASLDDGVAKLTALPGIGAWTAQYIAMRGLGEPDAFPASDLGVRKALATNGRLPSERETLAAAQAWRPWRGYAVIALWTRPSSARPRSRHRPRKESS
jgi:AraC family transcriptional regulator of adaptative response / DNA-3-methyladenine glycosylase II